MAMPRETRKPDRRLTLLTYSPHQAERSDLDQVPTEPIMPQQGSLRWLNVSRPSAEDLGALAELIDMHPLEREIIAQGDARPGLDLWNGHHLITLRGMALEGDATTLQVQPISLPIKDRLLVSIQSGAVDLFASIESAIAQGRGRVRRMGIGYLLYLLLDRLLDQYSQVLSVSAIGRCPLLRQVGGAPMEGMISADQYCLKQPEPCATGARGHISATFAA